MEHPIQPIAIDGSGVARFKKNEIVRFLLDSGPFDLNALALMPFSDEDRSQFAQLIGYSVSGFGSLDYANQEQVQRADEIVESTCCAESDGDSTALEEKEELAEIQENLRELNRNDPIFHKIIQFMKQSDKPNESA